MLCERKTGSAKAAEVEASQRLVPPRATQAQSGSSLTRRAKQSVGLFRRQRPTLRKDDRAYPALELALRGPFHGDWPLEAVENLASPAWIPLVELHRQNASPENAARFGSSFDSALAACRQATTDPQ